MSVLTLLKFLYETGFRNALQLSREPLKERVFSAHGISPLLSWPKRAKRSLSKVSGMGKNLPSQKPLSFSLQQ
ncbi:MAG: hypothetical protein HYR95_01405 [Candidatus Colwellbacteria bacterium]|nr:hypothetical protein [Candidatus Colwellbacteria bacterium]